MSWYDIVYKISNETEKKLMIYAECSSLDMTEIEFEDIYNQCVSEKIGILCIRTNQKWNGWKILGNNFFSFFNITMSKIVKTKRNLIPKLELSYDTADMAD